jgi:diaminohydroxyphosphoribosylaminopyrimidine deaminase/5-amino-6-(5-phosphoribosylamino)uracil reductase
VLGERKINSVFVEAGGRLAGSLISENRVNKLYMFMAPKLLHDAMALPALSGAINLALPNAPALTITHTQTLEGDWVIEAYPGTPPWRQPLCIVPALEA